MVFQKRKYPLFSTGEQLNKAITSSDSILTNNLSSKERRTLTNTNRQFIIGNDSRKKYKKDGRYIPERRKIHNSIMNNIFKDKSTIDKKDPDLYVLGGIAASGKSSLMAKRIPERTVNIDNDEFKKKLSKHNPSPIKRFPLAHASFFQEESSDLVKQSLERARVERRDITLDVTIANKEKIRKIVDRFKRDGYDTHLLATQKFPHKSVVDSTKRFLAKGRFVPPFIIASKGNTINKNVMEFRKETDSHVIEDTNDFDNIITVSKSKKDLRHNFRDP